jgi:hypothetical protein
MDGLMLTARLLYAFKHVVTVATVPHQIHALAQINGQGTIVVNQSAIRHAPMVDIVCFQTHAVAHRNGPDTTAHCPFARKDSCLQIHGMVSVAILHPQGHGIHTCHASMILHVRKQTVLIVLRVSVQQNFSAQIGAARLEK